MSPHLISRVSILGTGLIGGSFALALRKYTADMHISGWDRPDAVREAQNCGAIDESFSGDLASALHNSDLIYIALPIAATIDLLPEIARHAPSHALITDACSTKVRIAQAADELFPDEMGPFFLGGHPMAGREQWAHFVGEKFVGGLGDADFSAAGVSDERVGRSVARDFRKKINGRSDGKGDVDQIGIMQSRGQIPGERFVDGAAVLRFTNGIGAVPAGDVHIRSVFPQRQGERAADQPSAENTDARDEVGGHLDVFILSF